jgi:two-component system, chemotaxis family, sensor kinase CheA
MNEEALTQELMATYRAEARERLEAITRVLLEIERDPSGSKRAQHVEHIFREVHSLKGAARSVSETAVERVAHAFEDAIVAARKRPTDEDLPLHDWYGHLDELIALTDQSVVAAVPLEESIRVATPRLDRLMADVGALLVGEQARAQLVRDLTGLAESLTSAEQRWHRSQAGRQSGGWPDDLHDVHQRLKLSIQVARQQQAEMRRQLDTLDNDIRELRMMTVGGLFRSFERMVKDLTRETGKRVALELLGEATNVDKGVLDALRDPLLHLIRNAIDHGIETPAERESAGKPATAQLTLRADRAGNVVVITVSDDGRGIDLAGVRGQAVRLGLLSTAQAEGLNGPDVFELLFRSGLSTRTEASEVSGRGLGLAIVRQAVERLRGQVVVERSGAQGTVFRLSVPLTLSTTRCLLVRALGGTQAIPLELIERTALIRPEQILTVQGQPTIRLDGRAVSLFWRERASPRVKEKTPVVIFQTRGGLVAFPVDALLGEQELVVKPFPALLPPVPTMTGASTLPSGEVVLILNPIDLIDRHARVLATLPTIPWSMPAPEAEEGGLDAQRPLRILVAEDSLTTRTLMRNILRAAGYEVVVTPDGAAAWEALQTERFDLLVSDIEMPNLDGIGLTQRIRATPTLLRLPVILVTARAGADDRARGLQAGADAYISKGDFRQSELLDALYRLLGRGASLEPLAVLGEAV